MTIDGTNITTAYGLVLSSPAAGLFSQPARKKILSEPAFTAGAIRFESKEVKVELVGVYETEAALVTNIELFKTKIRSLLVHTWLLVIDNETFTGVVASGVKVEITKAIAQVSFTIEITTVT
jgi:hypothetical protein